MKTILPILLCLSLLTLGCISPKPVYVSDFAYSAPVGYFCGWSVAPGAERGCWKEGGSDYYGTYVWCCNDTLGTPAVVDGGSKNLANDSRNPANATCHWQLAANGAYLPDPACSPGDVFNATLEEICVSGYSASVRNVSEKTKDAVYAAYGITVHNASSYEMDHSIPLSIGGSNEPINLFPEPAEPKPGFREKDVVENFVHRSVCNGSMPLAEAQQGIAEDWTQYYKGG